MVVGINITSQGFKAGYGENAGGGRALCRSFLNNNYSALVVQRMIISIISSYPLCNCTNTLSYTLSYHS
jgi:hypothetical protein